MAYGTAGNASRLGQGRDASPGAPRGGVTAVPGHQRDEVLDGHAAAGGVDAAPLPLLGLEPAQESEAFLPPPPERGERLSRVVSQVLPLGCPAVGLHRQELWLVHGHPVPPTLAAPRAPLAPLGQPLAHWPGSVGLVPCRRPGCGRQRCRGCRSRCCR